MSARRAAVVVLAILGTAVLGACGGGGDDDDANDDDGGAATEEQADAQAEESPATAADDVTVPDITIPETVSEVNILTDFGDVCRGVSLPGATAYDAARAGVHPIMTMAGEDPDYEGAGALLPDTWDPVIGQEQTVELVVCLDRTASTLTQECDGYLDDDGNDTGNKVAMYDASYDVRLVAATTGDVVASTQMDATEPDCPMLAMFDADDPVKDEYAEPVDELTAWLADYVET